MRKKLRLILKILLFVVVTCSCIALGFYSRYTSGIVVTQFETQATRSMGYMLETKEQRLVIVDGGLPENTAHIEETIINKGGIVDAWFVTHIHEDHTGALLEIIKSGKVQINNIYVSLNSEEWYLQYEDTNRHEAIKEFLNTLDQEEIRDKVHDVALREEITIDNLNFKILKIKSPEQTENAGNNQSMVIKVSNNFKSMMFLGDLGEEYEEEFIQSNLDEMEATAVQMAHHGQAGVSEKFYQKLNPEICFWPTTEAIWTNENGTGNYKTLETRSWIEKIGDIENYVAKDGDITIRIW